MTLTVTLTVILTVILTVTVTVTLTVVLTVILTVTLTVTLALAPALALTLIEGTIGLSRWQLTVAAIRAYGLREEAKSLYNLDQDLKAYNASPQV